MASSKQLSVNMRGFAGKMSVGSMPIMSKSDAEKSLKIAVSPAPAVDSRQPRDYVDQVRRYVGDDRRAREGAAAKPAKRQPKPVIVTVDSLTGSVMSRRPVESIDGLSDAAISSMLPKGWSVGKVRRSRGSLKVEAVQRVNDRSCYECTKAVKASLPKLTSKRDYVDFSPVSSLGPQPANVCSRMSSRLSKWVGGVRRRAGLPELSSGSKKVGSVSLSLETVGFGFPLPPEAIADQVMSVWVGRLSKLTEASKFIFSPYIRGVKCSMSVSDISQGHGKDGIYELIDIFIYSVSVEVEFFAGGSERDRI